MSTKTRRFVAESFDVAPVDVGTEHEATIGQICEDLAVDHTELCQLLDQAEAVKTVADEFPEEKVLTISEERFLSAFVGMATAGMGVTVEQLKVFKETPEGKALSLEAFEGGIWETIKRVIKAIIDKILQFWNWLTGSGKKVEAKQAATEKKLQDLTEEKLHERMDKLGKEIEQFSRDVDADNGTDTKVSKEDFEYAPTHTHGVHRISGARLAQFTDKAPTGGVVFAEDIVAAVHNSLNNARGIFQAMRELAASKENAEKLTTDEQRITFVSELMHKIVSHLPFKTEGGRKELHVIGATYLIYDEKDFAFRLESKDHGIEMAKNYVIGVRSLTELRRSYSDYVSEYRDTLQAENGSLKQVAEAMRNQLHFVEEDIQEKSKLLEDAKASEARQKMFKIIVHAVATLLSSLSRISSATASLESSVFNWLPVHA